VVLFEISAPTVVFACRLNTTGCNFLSFVELDFISYHSCFNFYYGVSHWLLNLSLYNFRRNRSKTGFFYFVVTFHCLSHSLINFTGVFLPVLITFYNSLHTCFTVRMLLSRLQNCRLSAQCLRIGTIFVALDVVGNKR
jgi:hypothetical protein